MKTPPTQGLEGAYLETDDERHIVRRALDMVNAYGIRADIQGRVATRSRARKTLGGLQNLLAVGSAVERAREEKNLNPQERIIAQKMRGLLRAVTARASVDLGTLDAEEPPTATA